MGNNQAWLKLRGSSVTEVATAVRRSYEARGARVIGDTFDPGLPDRWSDGSDTMPSRLGVVVHPSHEPGWLLLSDSWRYTTDARLADDLAASLGTTVFRYDVADIVDSFTIERFGASIPLPSQVELDTYHDTWSRSPEAVYLVFDQVTGYDDAVRNVLDQPCPACGLRWTPGIDVPSRPEQLLSVRGGTLPVEPRVLFAWTCGTVFDGGDRECGVTGWGRGVVRDQLLVELQLVATLDRTAVEAIDAVLDREALAEVQRLIHLQ